MGAVRLVAAAAQRGISVRPSDVYRHPTVAALAAVASAATSPLQAKAAVASTATSPPQSASTPAAQVDHSVDTPPRNATVPVAHFSSTTRPRC